MNRRMTITEDFLSGDETHSDEEEKKTLPSLLQRLRPPKLDPAPSKPYSLVSNEEERKAIAARIEKGPKHLKSHDFDTLFKIVLIGESHSGKTSMLLRFSDNSFTDNYLCTIGVDFKIKTLRIDGAKLVKMQIWDTAGQERFRSISQAYYRNSQGCIAVYDITNRTSFQEIRSQVENFVAYSSKEVARNIILVGNKCDLAQQRAVQFEEAVELAKSLNLAAVFETSAKDNLSIDDVFFRSIINSLDAGANGGRPTALSSV